jgi:hypothetical protein
MTNAFAERVSSALIASVITSKLATKILTVTRSNVIYCIEEGTNETNLETNL